MKGEDVETKEIISSIDEEGLRDSQLQMTIEKKTKQLSSPLKPDKNLNEDRVVYYENLLRNMRLLTADNLDPNILTKVIDSSPFQIDIMKVFHDKIYVVTAEKQMSVFDRITFAEMYGDKKLVTSEVITCACFFGDKIYVGQKNKVLEIFDYSSFELIKRIELRGEVSCLMTLDACGIVVCQDDGFFDIFSPYNDSVIVQERHPFCDKINWALRTSRVGETELAIVTAGQVYFTSIEMKNSEDKGIQTPSKILFELDELYIEEGAQIVRVEEYEPEKFAAFTWWTNKIYIFERSSNFLVNKGEVFSEKTRIINASFGISIQVVGFYKIQKTKSIFLMKCREGLIMLDAEKEQMFKLNFTKSNSTIAGDLFFV